MDKANSHWGQEVAKGKQKVKVSTLPIKSPFKLIGLQVLEIMGCAGEGQQQTGNTQMGYLDVVGQISH